MALVPRPLTYGHAPYHFSQLEIEWEKLSFMVEVATTPPRGVALKSLGVSANTRAGVSTVCHGLR